MLYFFRPLVSWSNWFCTARRLRHCYTIQDCSHSARTASQCCFRNCWTIKLTNRRRKRTQNQTKLRIRRMTRRHSRPIFRSTCLTNVRPNSHTTIRHRSRICWWRLHQIESKEAWRSKIFRLWDRSHSECSRCWQVTWLLIRTVFHVHFFPKNVPCCRPLSVTLPQTCFTSLTPLPNYNWPSSSTWSTTSSRAWSHLPSKRSIRRNLTACCWVPWWCCSQHNFPNAGER